MKTLSFAILFTFTCYFSFAQKGYMESGYLRDLYAFSELPLDSIWEYSQSSDIANFQIKKQKVNTILLETENVQPLDWQGSGWFQKAFKLPDSLKNKSILFWIGHIGASEIYLDGRLILQYGKINSDFKLGTYYVPREPVLVTPDDRSIHVWTVHYTNQQLYKMGEPDVLKGFYFVMANQKYQSNQSIFSFNHTPISLSLIIPFCLFFFCVFLFYPKRLASLWTTLFLLNFSMIFLMIYLNNTTTDGYKYQLFSQLWKTAVIALNSLLVITFYSLYYPKLPKRTFLVFVILAVSIILVWVFPSAWNYAPIVMLLLWIEAIRISILGIKHHKPGFWILAIGQFIGVFYFFIFIDNSFGLFDFYKISYFQEISRMISDMINPITFALQLAWEFGSSNRSLQDQLGHVKKLSAENLVKEQEKQDILASQNETLERQVEARTGELKASQAQLIQKEKLASLGELTAGIAHEIQNPLNFVNNFSEVSIELIDELSPLTPRGGIEEELLADISQNLQKINHHGKRASSIVKGMLDHSRTSTGVKELTDINVLADEYLRLSYHGLKAKDSNFKADYQLIADESLPKILVIPQEIGRVLLNLINNAFQSQAPNPQRGLKVVVRTFYIEPNEKAPSGCLGASVSDNGNGIPKANLEKIFQPFFTTKPTGEGTGLGLSLSYDIITKGHGGTLEVVSEEGNGAEFIITLPLDK